MMECPGLLHYLHHHRHHLVKKKISVTLLKEDKSLLVH